MVKLTEIPKILIYCFILLLFSEKVAAQEQYFIDKRMIFEDFYSTFPGEYDILSNNTISLFYSLPFNLKELSTKSLNIIIPIRNIIRFESLFSDFGSNKYGEKKIGISLSKNFGKYIAFGISFDFKKLKIKNYGELSEKNGGAGASLNFKKVRISFFELLNRNRQKNMRFIQVSANTIENINFTCILKKEESYPLQKICYFTYFNKLAALFIGFGENPAHYSLGISFLIRMFKISYQLKEDLNLGTTQYFCFYIYL